jgi:hypothetical protein
MLTYIIPTYNIAFGLSVLVFYILLGALWIFVANPFWGILAALIPVLIKLSLYLSKYSPWWLLLGAIPVIISFIAPLSLIKTALKI